MYKPEYAPTAAATKDLLPSLHFITDGQAFRECQKAMVTSKCRHFYFNALYKRIKPAAIMAIAEPL